MKKSVEVESRRIGGTGLVVGQGEGVGLVVGEGVSQGEGRGEGAGAPCPVQAHSCACPTKQASPSSTPPQFAAALQSAALRGSGQRPVSLASEVTHAAAPQSTVLRGSGRSPVSLASKGGVA